MTPGLLLRRRTVLASAAGVAALGAAALTACTEEVEAPPAEAGDAPSDGPAVSDEGGAAEPSAPATPAAAAAETSLTHGRAEVTVGVRPIVRHDGHLVLTLDVVAEDPDGDLGEDLVTTLSHVWGSASRTWRGVRLIDLEGDAVAVPALANEIEVLVGVGSVRGGIRPATAVQLVFGDLGTDAVALYLPKCRLLEDLPVLGTGIPALDEEVEPLDLSSVLAAPTVPIVALSDDLRDPLHEERQAGTVTIDIGADVLFDSSSAELSTETSSVLDEAAARILQHEPGPVTVVGHTDDVDDEAFNMDLSRRRADAVAAALGDRIDTAVHPLATEGRGESEPVADNTTAEGRARNRRVSVHITTPLLETAIGAEDDELPPFDGESAPGTEGLVVAPNLSRPPHLRALGARLVAEHLVVTLELVLQDELTDAPSGPGGFSENLLLRDDIRFAFTDGGIGVVTGSTLTLPGVHLSAEGDVLVPLTDLSTATRLDGGVPRVLELVYPRDIPGIAPGGSITLQMAEQAFRLTDIPIDG